MTRIDWPVLMRAGLRDAGLTPEVFWGLTPAELQLVLGEPAGGSPLGRGGLEALMAAYPDEAHPMTEKGA